MVSKKDIVNVAMWTSIIDISLASTFAVTTLLLNDEEMRIRLRLGFNSMVASSVAGMIEGRYLVSMSQRYEPKDLRNLVNLVLGVSATSFGILNGYGSSKLEDMNLASCVTVGIYSAMLTTIQSFTALVISSNFRPLKLPDFIIDRKEASNLKLKQVLSYDESQDKDIFETLERYNKVYKKMLTRLGTPYEMAKITNNKGVAKRIVEKNNKLILQSLLGYKIAKDNARRIN